MLSCRFLHENPFCEQSLENLMCNHYTQIYRIGVKMHNKKHIILNLIVVVLLAGFVLIPFRTSDLAIRVTYENAPEGKTELFYSVKSDPGIKGDLKVTSEVENDVSVLTLDHSLRQELSELRLDIPQSTELVNIKTIELVSGGFTVKSYKGYELLASAHVSGTNDIISVDPYLNNALIGTGADPFFVFDSSFTEIVNQSFSRYYVSKLIFALLIASGCIFTQKKKDVSES